MCPALFLILIGAWPSLAPFRVGLNKARHLARIAGFSHFLPPLHLAIPFCTRHHPPVVHPPPHTRLWITPQAVSTRHHSEADARLEYLAWRTWFMKRQHSNAELRRARKGSHLEDSNDDIVDNDSTTSGEQGRIRRMS